MRDDPQRGPDRAAPDGVHFVAGGFVPSGAGSVLPASAGWMATFRRGELSNRSGRWDARGDSPHHERGVHGNGGAALEPEQTWSKRCGRSAPSGAWEFSARKVTISTVGLPKAIEKLAEQLELPVTLALSLHAPNDDLRRQLIPWAEYTTIKDLLTACQKWFDKTGARSRWSTPCFGCERPARARGGTLAGGQDPAGQREPDPLQRGERAGVQAAAG
jgi:hypothetical protein